MSCFAVSYRDAETSPVPVKMVFESVGRLHFILRIRNVMDLIQKTMKAVMPQECCLAQWQAKKSMRSLARLDIMRK